MSRSAAGGRAIMKWLFKWLFRLFLLAAVLIVILLLSFNSILRVYVEHRIRAQTGMDAEIGRFSVGLAEPTVTIQNFKLYNPPDFGGTPFLDIREIHVEYDRAALARHETSPHPPALQSRRTRHREKRGRPHEHFFTRPDPAFKKIRRRQKRGGFQETDRLRVQVH